MIEIGKSPAIAVGVNLELDLTDGQRFLVGICIEECSERVKFASLNVNLENVDKRVT
jgi:hypothetical protein